MKRYIKSAVKDVLDEPEDIRYELGFDQNTRPEVLERLASSQDYYTRCAVARNPSTPVELLQKLAKDLNKNVRTDVADNPNTPEDILRILAKDSDVVVRRYVSRNPNTPVDVLRKFFDDPEILYTDLACNPNCPQDKMMEIAENCYDHPFIQDDLLRNPNVTLDVVRYIAQHGAHSVKHVAEQKLQDMGEES